MRISDWSSDVCSSDLIGLERAQYIEKFAKIVFVRHRDSKGLRCRGLGHEPEAELGHDAKIGLCEEPVDPGPVTKFEELPAGTLGHSTHPCPDTAAVGQHQLKRSEEHTSELQSLMRISYAVFCLKKNKTQTSH